MSAPDVDGLIRCLLTASDETPADIDANEVFNLCRAVTDIMFEEPSLVMLYDDYHIIGDIHGYYTGLLTIFDEIGHPDDDTNYIFLGDYVDRGPRSLETVLLLFSYKVKYPTSLYLLRGNHECSPINTVYGFLNECQQRFNNDFVYQALNRAFDYLPLAAIIYDRIFCCHGGIPKDLEKLNELRSIKRPLIHWKFGSMVYDLLWSDPNPNVQGFEPNTERKISHFFGPESLDEFLERFELSLVCRGHQFVQNGFELFQQSEKLVTIFSALNYHNNRIGMMSITNAKNHLECLCLSLPGYSYRVIKIPLEKPVKVRKGKLKRERKMMIYREIAEMKDNSPKEAKFMEQILEEPDVDQQDLDEYVIVHNKEIQTSL